MHPSSCENKDENQKLAAKNAAEFLVQALKATRILPPRPATADDCEVTIGPGTTTLRADLPDRGALSGLIERINSLGLDVIDVSLVAPPSGR